MSQHSIDESDIQAVVSVLRSDTISRGNKTKGFEQAIADYVGAKYAVAFCNGTAALHAACFAVGIDKGDEVLTTPLTFVASSNAILYCGGRPVFVDIDDTHNINPELIKPTPKTKAILAVDYAGLPCDIDELKKFGLPIIEDGCHALGAEYKGRKVGSLSGMTCFSFHPVKIITTGEGGMVTTDNPEYSNRLRVFRDSGRIGGQMVALGHNYWMSDIQAALGISQLKKINRFLARRNQIAQRYFKYFPIKMRNGHAFHFYPIEIERRDTVYEVLKPLVNIHYRPVHTQPYYVSLGYKRDCPEAERFYERELSLPVYPSMTNEQVEYIIRRVKDEMGS
jgi:dTDP-4-amino-4,6-dideoxygalactose transaminase